MGEIVVFSREGCPHCVEAKTTLGQLDVPFTEIRVDEDLRNGMLMSWISGQHTVPQIYFNNDHVGGAADLKTLDSEEIKSRTRAAIDEPEKPGFLTREITDEELLSAVMPLRAVIDPYVPEDPTAVPEYEAVRIWYGSMFGFLCNGYDQMILKPEPTALWIAVLGAAMQVVGKRVGSHFGTVCFATAIRAECAYCSAHGAGLAMQYANVSPENFKILNDFLGEGKGTLEDLPFTDEVKAMINMASKMTDHSVTTEDVKYSHRVFGSEKLREACYSVAGMGIVMGFLNRFNDLVGVEIEASVKQSIDTAVGDGWDWGTHDTEDDANRYPVRDLSTPSAAPDEQDLAMLLGDVKAQVVAHVEPLLNKYGSLPDKHLPVWIASLPDDDTIRTVGALYHSLFNAGEIPSETKHLAAFALALGSGYPKMADEEARILTDMTGNSAAMERQLQKTRKFAITWDQAMLKDLDPGTRLALQLAECSASFPHVVRGKLVQALAAEYSPAQIIELVMALAVIGIGQRWLGVIEPLEEYLLGR